MNFLNCFFTKIRIIFSDRRRLLSKMAIALLLFLSLGCSLSIDYWRSATVDSALDSPLPITVAKTNELVAPLPSKIEGLNQAKVALGEQLFADPRLSSDNTVSCVSCHNLQLGGTDREKVSVGINNARGTMNAPTVLNSGFNFRQFWDGRAESLEEQIDGPIFSPQEMGSSWSEVTNKLQQDPNYRRQFRQIYGSKIHRQNMTKSQQGAEITPDRIKDAIATYERSLITPNAPFDRYLGGDLNALNSEQKQGYEKFKGYGCVSCHQGINIGGNMFQRFGVFGNYFEDMQDTQPEDLGRYNVTGDPLDLYVFKVPSLRNVELTLPYFHDGSVETLAEAVRIMGQYQLGRILSTEDVDAIVEFLRSLTGKNLGAISEEER